MSITMNRVLNSFEGHLPSSGVEKALLHIAASIDNLDDLIKNSHNIQMVSRKADDLSEKKTKALMIVIEKIMTKFHNYNELFTADFQRAANKLEIYKLFEKAKAISRAESETEFQSAIADL